MEITYRARSYFIEKIEQETDEALSARAWLVIKLLDSTGGIDRGAPTNLQSSTTTNTQSSSNTQSSNTLASTISVKLPDKKLPVSFDEAILLSKYWYYVKNYDCKYSPDIMERISQAEKLLFI